MNTAFLCGGFVENFIENELRQIIKKHIFAKDIFICYGYRKYSGLHK